MPRLDGKDKATDRDPWNGICTAMNVLAIDPGDAHIGMAEFEEGRCVQAWEEDPASGLRHVQNVMLSGWLDALVVEAFVLYPWKAREQAFSQLLTSQYIGALKLMWATGGTIDLTGVIPPFKWIQQGADIKKPMFAQLRARKIPMLSADVTGQHAKDAEAHGYYFLFNDPETKENNLNEYL